MKSLLIILALSLPAAAQLPEQINDTPTMENQEFLLQKITRLEKNNIFSIAQTFNSDVTFNIPATSSMTRTCPTGFTSVQKQGNQLGCIQTAEAGSDNQVAASTMCFAGYGGRLPTFSETDIAFNFYALTDEGDDDEWTGDLSFETTINGIIREAAGTGSVEPRSYVNAYRCWINR